MRIVKLLSVLLALLMAGSLLLVSCGEKNEDEKAESTVYYTVTFDPNNGQEKDVRQIAAGGKIARPDDPEWEGYFFGGWLDGTLEWDFENGTVREDLTLRATWFSAESYFGFELLEEGGDEVVITELKKTREELKIPTTIKTYQVVAIGDGVFEGQTSDKVTRIVLPESITSVGERAFAGCTDVEIVVEGTLTSVGEAAFYECNGLGAVTLGEGLTEIAAEAFRGCTGLKAIGMPKSATVIEENAFDSCTALTTVMLYDTVSAIEDGAFHDCDALKAVYCYGTEDSLTALLEERTANGNEALETVACYLYSETAPTGETVYDGYWYLDGGRIKLWK